MAIKLFKLFFCVVLLCAFGFLACDNGNDNDNDSPLNGTWVNGSIELKFHNGNFEWTAYGNLQQRGTYDINNGVLTITIAHNYGSPQYFLGQYSRPYSINGNTLTWASTQYIRR